MLEQLPDSVIVLGGGPVGIELGQFLVRFGARVTLVQAQERLIPREEPAVGALIAEALRNEGVDLRLGTSAESVARGAGAYRVSLSDGEQINAAELLVPCCATRSRSSRRSARCTSRGLKRWSRCGGGAVRLANPNAEASLSSPRPAPPRGGDDPMWQ